MYLATTFTKLLLLWTNEQIVVLKNPQHFYFYPDIFVKMFPTSIALWFNFSADSDINRAQRGEEINKLILCSVKLYVNHYRRATCHLTFKTTSTGWERPARRARRWNTWLLLSGMHTVKDCILLYWTIHNITIHFNWVYKNAHTICEYTVHLWYYKLLNEGKSTIASTTRKLSCHVCDVGTTMT